METLKRVKVFGFGKYRSPSKGRKVGQMKKAEEPSLISHTNVFGHFPKENVEMLKCLKQGN